MHAILCSITYILYRAHRFAEWNCSLELPNSPFKLVQRNSEVLTFATKAAIRWMNISRISRIIQFEWKYTVPVAKLFRKRSMINEVSNYCVCFWSLTCYSNKLQEVFFLLAVVVVVAPFSLQVFLDSSSYRFASRIVAISIELPINYLDGKSLNVIFCIQTWMCSTYSASVGPLNYARLFEKCKDHIWNS